MALNEDLKSKEIAKKKKISAKEPHLSVNQRLILDDVIDIIEDVIPIDIMEVRTIISDSLKKWESDNNMWFSNLDKMSEDEIKSAMDEFFIYFEQIATKKWESKAQNQKIIKSLYKAREEYFSKYHPIISKKKQVLYLSAIIVAILAAYVLLYFVSPSLNIFPYRSFWSFPAFP